METLLLEKVGSFTKILGQIKTDIQNRKILSKEIIYRIYQHYFYLKSYLFGIDQWGIGVSRDIEQRRTSLEQQLNQLKHEKRQEQILCWKDTANLNEEFRKWFKQYADLSQRVRLILSPDR